jgi:hypothetical protein
VIICEIIVHLLVIVQNNKRCTVQGIEIKYALCSQCCGSVHSQQMNNSCAMYTVALSCDIGRLHRRWVNEIGARVPKAMDSLTLGRFCAFYVIVLKKSKVRL